MRNLEPKVKHFGSSNIRVRGAMHNGVDRNELLLDFPTGIEHVGEASKNISTEVGPINYPAPIWRGDDEGDGGLHDCDRALCDLRGRLVQGEGSRVGILKKGVRMKSVGGHQRVLPADETKHRTWAKESSPETGATSPDSI